MLSLLEHNCHTLYNVQATSRHTLPLVANYAGTHIYDSRYFWGRLWICFYSIAQWFNPHLRVDKLKQAVIHTHLLFHKTLATSLTSLTHYYSYLDKASEGPPLDEASYMTHRQQLNAWNRATRPFKKILKQCSDPRIEKLFAECFKQNRAFDSPDLMALRHIHCLLAVEGHLRGPLPLACFKKVLIDQPLTALENKKCIKWINKLNSSALGPHHLQKAIQTLVVRLAPSLPQTQASIKLLLWLEKKGCQLFYKTSPKHLRWVNTLVSGVAIDNTKELVIEREINPSIEGRNTRAFSLCNNQNSIATVAQNQARLYLRDNGNTTKTPPEVGVATISGIYENGKYALVEKLHSLENFPWATSEKEAAVDELLLTRLSQLVKYFLMGNHSLRGFSTRTLLIDGAGKLKLTKPLAASELDFNALEEFISKSAGNNHIIYMRLMKDSGMLEHPVAKFYQDLIRHQLQKEPISSENLAGIYKITDPKVVDRGIALIKDIQCIQNKLYQQLQGMFPQKPFTQLQNEANATILRIYASSGHASILPHYLFEHPLL